MQVSLQSSEHFYSQSSLTLSSQRNHAGQEQAAPTDKLLDKLADNIPGMSGSELKNLKADQFTPEKVSGRIANFVAMGLERARLDGKSEEEIQTLYEQAVSGIEQGFNEARDILKDMNLLSDDIASTIDSTFELTMEKVGALAPNAAPISSATTTSISAAERYESAESFSLKLRTQDGDKISIQFASSDSIQSSLGYFNDGEGSDATVFSVDRNQSSNFQFSVKGDLDEGELDAIQNLIQDISLIADDFFDGDVQAAFQQASSFEMDKSELASMNLTLKRSEQYSSVAAYQQVQGYDQTVNQAGGRKLGHLMQGLEQQFNQSRLAFLESAADFGQSLFESLVQQDARYRESSNEQQQGQDNKLATLRELLSTSNTQES